ncbi:MAG: STAS domain-containing protein [Leptospiraceae bacterium]|nr:STAS domain-containing protein [Leptospiraceae bacterium]MCK6381506.1 STAS domain-containing protein [Leptospiraceae bacterium]NUM41124.1 STAS domain-containing protein [Leptospiraceae bacterium]
MVRTDFDSFYFETDVLHIGELPVMLVELCGKISNNNAFEISKKISIVFEDKIYNLILDLSSLEYINSTGIAMLLTIIRTVAQKNGKIVIGGIHPFLETILNLIEIPKDVVIYESKDKAKSAWS